jgi:hypothetical protein
MVDVLQRYTWTARRRRLGDVFRLRKASGARELGAVCQPWSHQFGWELRLNVSGELQQPRVYRSQDETFSPIEEWKAAMTAKGLA